MSDFGFDPAVVFANVLVPLQILFVDLLLSADNALLIAMACRGLGVEDTRHAALFGTLGAICLRIAMGSVALILLRTPYLRIAAGLILLYVAVRLTLQRDDEETHALLDGTPLDEEDLRRRGRKRVLSAIGAIVVADSTMSFDNVVAVAAIAQDSLIFLAGGLMLSIPMLVWGSTLIREFLDQNHVLVRVSGAFLGWIAGSIAISDPTIAPFIDVYAPALPFAVPIACAIFVIWQSLIFDPHRQNSRGDHAE